MKKVERLNLVVDSDAKAKLADLAGSERKMGEYVGKLIEKDWEARKYSLPEVYEVVHRLAVLTHRALNQAAALHACPHCGRPLQVSFEVIDGAYTEIFCEDCGAISEDFAIEGAEPLRQGYLRYDSIGTKANPDEAVE